MTRPFQLLVFFLCACATTPPAHHGHDAAAPAPWNDNAPVAAPEVVIEEWQKAENRTICAPMTIADFGERARHATLRRANFGGGWGVAWDAAGLPGRDPSGAACATCGRGVFGIAGGGITWGESEGSAVFPHHIEWQDGNYATYGLEGRTGPNWLAQLRVADQRCVYYVWSFLGREHLEHLIGHVRRARIP